MIVHPPAFREQALRLLHHKRATGMTAHSYALASLIDGVSGVDDAEKLKKAIYGAVRDERRVRYVFLLGDATLIPVRYRRTLQQRGVNNVPYQAWYTGADLYYANLYRKHEAPRGSAVPDTESGFSDWDADGNQAYDDHHWDNDDVYDWNPDEVDGCPDVAVGRLPVQSEDQLRIYVDKVIAYETGPGPPGRVAFLADKKYPTAETLMLRIAEDGELAANGLAVDRFGFGYAPGDHPPAGLSVSRRGSTETATRDGCFTVYIGHGSTNTWDFEVEGDAALLSGANVAAFTNGTQPVVVSIGCSTGEWVYAAPDHAQPSYRDVNGIVHSFSSSNSRRDNSGTWTVTDNPVGRPDLNRTWTVEDKDAPKVPVPRPAEYDFNRPSPTFALSWLLNPVGGGIAFCGETTVAQDNWGADFATGLFQAWRGSGTVLGDMWRHAGRFYWQMYEKSQDTIGAPRCYLTYMTLFGDPSLRVRLRPSSLPPAPLVRESWSARWTTGWTSIVALPGGLLFSYKSTSGSAAVDRVNAAGQGTTPLWTGALPAGYTSAAFVSIDGASYVLVYNVSSGTVATHPVTPAGQVGAEVWRTTWTSGWTSIRPFSLNGHPHLLLYKSGDGTVVITRVNVGGLGTAEVWRSRWTIGWTSVVVLPLGGTPHLFLYKSGDGTAVITRVNPGGIGTTELWRATWTTGWTCVGLSPLREILSYKPVDGTAAIDLADGAGNGTEELWRAIWNTGYTALVPIALPVGALPGHAAVDLYCLCYDTVSGDVAIKAVGAYRQQT